VLELLPQTRDTAPDLVDAILDQQESAGDAPRPAQAQLPEPLTEHTGPHSGRENQPANR
jgi:hypothetical protein